MIVLAEPAESTLAAKKRRQGKVALFGSTLDRQKASTKEQDPIGLLNEGFRYRDPSTGTFLSRDPLGFKAGPNMYTYVRQNPWTHFDPEGLDTQHPPPPPPPKISVPKFSLNMQSTLQRATQNAADFNRANPTAPPYFGFHSLIATGRHGKDPNSAQRS